MFWRGGKESYGSKTMRRNRNSGKQRTFPVGARILDHFLRKLDVLSGAFATTSGGAEFPRDSLNEELRENAKVPGLSRS